MLSNNKKISFFVLFVALLVVVSGCAKSPVVVNNKPTENRPVKNNPQIANTTNDNSVNIATTTTNEISTSSVDGIDTSNWLTYTNNKIGYEMKYPKSWKCEDPTVNNYYFTCILIDNSTELGTIPSLKINRIKNYSDPMDFLKVSHKNNSPFPLIPEKPNCILSGKECVRIVYEEGFEDAKNNVVEIVQKHDSGLIIIDAYLDMKEKERKTVEKMLETIKFK